jgi:hypothetical protein
MAYPPRRATSHVLVAASRLAVADREHPPAFAVSGPYVARASERQDRGVEPNLSLTGIEAGQAVVAVLAVLAISGEHSTGMIRTTVRRRCAWPWLG